MTQHCNVPAQLLRLPEVMRRTGYRRSTIYRLMPLGRFPKQIKLGERSSAWLASEVDAWVAARVAERDQPLTALAA
jgi:prophage regulatory protein